MESFGGEAFRTTRRRSFLLEEIARNDEKAELRAIFARQPLDDGVGGLAGARVENLNFARFGDDIHVASAPVENDHDMDTGPVLVIA